MGLGLQGDLGNGGTAVLALGNDLAFKFPGKPAKTLIVFGFGYVVHGKCPIENKWTLSRYRQRVAQDGFTELSPSLHSSIQSSTQPCNHGGLFPIRSSRKSMNTRTLAVSTLDLGYTSQSAGSASI